MKLPERIQITFPNLKFRWCYSIERSAHAFNTERGQSGYII